MQFWRHMQSVRLRKMRFSARKRCDLDKWNDIQTFNQSSQNLRQGSSYTYIRSRLEVNWRDSSPLWCIISEWLVIGHNFDTVLKGSKWTAGSTKGQNKYRGTLNTVRCLTHCNARTPSAVNESVTVAAFQHKRRCWQNKFISCHPTRQGWSHFYFSASGRLSYS